jgi:hypothetical protein
VSLRLAALATAMLAAGNAHAELYYLIVGGLGGDPLYAEQFAAVTQSMATAARRSTGDDNRVVVLSGESATREAVLAALNDLAAKTQASDRLAVFLIGHGSYDGTQYKFNLTGPDMDGAELLELLSAIPAGTQLVVNMTSASGAVREDWAVDGRSVITATRSGAERNATRFAVHWAEALSSEEADTDKDGIISAQEAFDFASSMVAESFESDGALATEHPEIEGDGAARFDVARLTARRNDTPELAELNKQLSGIEDQIAALRQRRDELGDDYFPQLQALLVQLSLVQEKIDAAEAE